MSLILEIVAAMPPVLALGGLATAVMFRLVKQLLARNGQLSRASRTKLFTTIVNRIFAFALVVTLVCVCAHVALAVWAPGKPISASCSDLFRFFGLQQSASVMAQASSNQTRREQTRGGVAIVTWRLPVSRATKSIGSRRSSSASQLRCLRRRG